MILYYPVKTRKLSLKLTGNLCEQEQMAKRISESKLVCVRKVGR
jgi:hypothetical protein